MSLIKVSVLNGIAVLIKVISGLILNKILAFFVGPSGYAVIGQFQNALQVISSLAGGLISSGVTKTTAQYHQAEELRHEVWKTAFRLSFLVSAVMAIVLLIAKDTLSDRLLNRDDMSSIFLWLPLSIPVMVATNLLLAITNGMREIGLYVSSNILGNVINLIVVGLFSSLWGLYGAILAYVVAPFFVLLSIAVMLKRCNWFRLRNIWGGVSSPALRSLSGFFLMGIAGAFIMPTTYILIRTHLIDSLGVEAAGYWQAAWKISEMYLMLITSTLTVYYLPRLAEIKSASELSAEIFRVYKFVMPIVIGGALLIYLLRNSMIDYLFTPEFGPVADILHWQLLGDVIRIGSWVLSYIMVGRAMVRHYLLIETMFAVSFLFFVYEFVGSYGLQGVAMGYSVAYCLYWGVMIIVVKGELRNMEISHER